MQIGQGWKKVRRMRERKRKTDFPGNFLELVTSSQNEERKYQFITVD